MVKLGGKEEGLAVFLGTDTHYGHVTNELVGRLENVHVYCDLASKDKQVEFTCDRSEWKDSRPLMEILVAGIRAIRGDE